MGRFAAMVLLFAFIFAMMVPDEFAFQGESDDAAPRPASIVTEDADPEAQAEEPVMPFSDAGTSIERSADGRFHVEALINGQSLPFLVDTGADQIALTVDDARSLGLDIDPDDFGPVGMGAGGVVNGLRVSLDSVEVVGRDIGALDAVVLDGLTHNLLGQSVLRRVGGLEISGDTMVIR